MEKFDVVVIGSGPGGYIAAIRAAQLGFKTACIEADDSLGGTCLNVGCIPSKALLQSSEAFMHASGHMHDLGVDFKQVDFDLKRMLDRKNKIVKDLTTGIRGLFKKNKITLFTGRGALVGRGHIRVQGKTETDLGADHVIVATGSVPIELPMARFDEKMIVSSTGALDFKKVPKHLVVIGGGVIGLELGSVWLRLGAEVTVIEAADSILSTMDEFIISGMTKSLKKQGMKFLCGTKFTGVNIKGKKLSVKFQSSSQDNESDLDCDKLLVAVGRRAYTDQLGLESIGVETEKNGKVIVDSRFRTNVEGVYAIGDVIAGPMLAHKAEEEAVACVEFLAGKAGHINYDAIPNVVYTSPEVASVGKTEKECRDAGINIKIGKFPFSANARARCAGETEGGAKIIADSRTDRILGAHLFGPHTSEIIGELAVGVEYAASSEDIARSVHAHPTLSEVVKEACLNVDKRALNI